MGISHKPSPGSQQHRLLVALLHGKTITPMNCFEQYNVMIPSARMAELRRMGWPIRAIEETHPNTELFPGSLMIVYVLDAHFRAWYGDPDNLGKHPGEYPFKDGRGKFEGWTAEDFAKGEKP